MLGGEFVIGPISVYQAHREDFVVYYSIIVGVILIL